MTYTKTLYRHPLDGVPILEPDVLPTPDQVLLGYEVFNYEKKNKCLVSPEPKKLNIYGWISAGVLLLLCWPLTCVPCCIGGFYDVYQKPVYGICTTDITYFS